MMRVLLCHKLRSCRHQNWDSLYFNKMSAKLTSHPESPEISGLLYKKRGGFGKMMPNAWQYRLFILSKDGVLTYYDTEVPENKDIFESKERGRIDLRAVKFELLIEATEGAPSPHTIIIAPDESEKWKLCADTKEDHTRWWKAIEKFSHEHTETKAAHLNIQSDDDFDLASPRNSRTRKSQINNSRTVDPDATAISNAATPLASAQGTSTFGAFPTSTSSAKPKASSSGHRKGGLRVGKETAMLSQEWIEWILVMVIVNLCLLGIIRTTAVLDRMLYVGVLNLVVAHTLHLRAHRSTTSAASSLAAATSAAASVVATTSTELTAAAAGAANTVAPGLTSLTATTANTATDAVSAGRSLMSQGKKPVAGFTLEQVFTEPKLSPEHTWCKADYRQFHVRVGPEYARYKKKAPSSAPIYEPFAVDVFCTKLRADHCSSRFEFSDPQSGAPINVDTHHAFVPPVFVIQIQIPSDPPTSFFSSAEDGPGWAILMYYRITEDAVRQLQDLSTASPAVKLFAEWCEKCTEDPLWRGRFKVINSCTNMDELGIPSAISAYNAKPIMIRRTGSISRGVNDGIRYMEMDIHVHKFATLAKQSIHYISSRCGQMFMQIGFVIEGVADAELPETLFACVAVNKPQEERAEFIFEDDA